MDFLSMRCVFTVIQPRSNSTPVRFGKQLFIATKPNLSRSLNRPKPSTPAGLRAYISLRAYFGCIFLSIQ